MKKLILIAVTVFFSLNATNLQAQINKRERIEAIKIAFITKRLNLSPQESQVFWPVYNQYQKEIGDLIMQRRAARKNPNPDAMEAIDDELDIESDIVAVRKKYKQEFTKVLAPEKISQFYQAERDFREELIKQLKNRKMGN